MAKSHRNAAIAVYETHAQAEAVVKELRRTGFDMRDISVVSKDDQTDESTVGYYNAGDRMKRWGASGVSRDAFWGLLVGSGMFLIPGIGPVLVAGPLVAWIVSAPEGAVAFGGMSAVGAGLHSIGIPKDSIVQYEAALKSDRFLLVAHGSTEDVEKARTVMAPRAAQISVHAKQDEGAALLAGAHHQ
jgi:uncharacterized membrane protein